MVGGADGSWKKGQEIENKWRKLNLELGRGFAWAEGCARDPSHAIKYPVAVVTVAPFDVHPRNGNF